VLAPFGGLTHNGASASRLHTTGAIKARENVLENRRYLFKRLTPLEFLLLAQEL
jgi:hypothetical protein